MQKVVDLVTAQPGVRAKDVAVAVIREDQNIRVGYRAIERCIKKRHIRGHQPAGKGLFLYLWDPELVAAAEEIERSAYERGRNLSTTDRAARMRVAADAWVEAGDESRARYLNRTAKSLEDGQPYALSMFPDSIPVTLV